ncbi:MAG: hypothetical protein JO028_19430, partial [Acidobacteriaceae bacterium]|nr:hypothetical protein [Acidobacteriaceae bacterium]
MLQELNGIERGKSHLELLLNGLRDLIGGEQALVGRGRGMVLFRDFRSLARLRFQFEGGLKEIDIAAGDFVKRTQRFGGFHAGESAIADELANHGSILLLHPSLIVLAVGSATSKFDTRSLTIVQHCFMDEGAVMIRIETT